MKIVKLFLIVAVVFVTFGCLTPSQADTKFVPANDPNIVYTGCVNQQFVADPDSPQRVISRFDRQFDIPGKGYRWDNPGASIRFRTDAALVVAHLYYSSLHTSASARNSKGVYSVDGAFGPSWTFQTQQSKVLREPETVNVTLSNGIKSGVHDYEIYLPYGDSVDFAGLDISDGATLVPTKPKSMVRYVAYGDSITHGFSATSVDKTYAFQVAKAKGWSLVNLGLGGRASNVPDGRLIGSLPADVITVLIGVNDWQAGAKLEQTQKNVSGFLNAVRVAHPTTPIYVITPLWVAPSWKPAGATIDLESYRQVLREIVAARNDANLHVIEGPSLIDHIATLFDVVAVHPNDAGLTMMAERLVQSISAVSPH
ncbi:MAG TPA: GDSL-type esterase/lipase family protein [Capsulimonadaceae bacterium]|jgi:lysophospholipase L1-like esterase